MGNPSQSRAERRLAAILAADVVGYSRLMSADEAGTAQALLEHRAAIGSVVANHGGRIVKTTGDGVLLEFSSVVAAVECASAIQRLMVERNADLPKDRQMSFRIGVNVGDVLVEGDDILGDGVNIAARLESIAEAGGVCISDDAYRQVHGKVSAQFVYGGEQQLKNIPRPVRVYRVLPQGSAGLRPPLALPDKPSIAILPFDNMSEVSENVYFADGIAEDIITELSRYPDLFVVARNSSFTYRGKVAPVADVGRELGVRYVLEGSVRRAGKRIRVSAQLIEAGSGKHLWAERYDRDLEDLFAIQDEVTRSIVGVLPERVEAAAFDQASRKTSNSLDAYDHLLRGKYCHHLETADANREAESHFDRSIELDPLFASAYAWKACTLGQALGSEFRPRTPELLEQIIHLLDRATSIDANDTECHRIMCRIALMQGQYPKTEYHLERALILNPNDPRLVVQRGINLTFLGDPEAAIPWIERAMRLDPFSAHRYYLDMVRALFMAQRSPEAIALLERTARSHWEHSLWLAACHAAMGGQAVAYRAGQQALSLRPNFSVGAYADGRFKWRQEEDRARLCAALAQAKDAILIDRASR
jgi:adenylate cyclase